MKINTFIQEDNSNLYEFIDETVYGDVSLGFDTLENLNSYVVELQSKIDALNIKIKLINEQVYTSI